MRSDMFKVIVERPRWGASHASSPKLKRTKDRTLKHIGHKRHAFENAPYTKSLNENLAPLVRFLRSRRGQPWDSVFSEICERLDTLCVFCVEPCWQGAVEIDDRNHCAIALDRHHQFRPAGRIAGNMSGKSMYIFDQLRLTGTSRGTAYALG